MNREVEPGTKLYTVGGGVSPVAPEPGRDSCECEHNLCVPIIQEVNNLLMMTSLVLCGMSGRGTLCDPEAVRCLIVHQKKGEICRCVFRMHL